MVLERAEVERLVAVAVVHGEQVAVGAAAGEPAVGAKAAVAGAHGSDASDEVRLAADLGDQGAELPHLGAELLHLLVPDTSGVADVDAGGRHRECGDVVGDEDLDDLDARVGAGADVHLRERSYALGAEVMGDHHGAVDVGARLDRDHDRVRAEGGVGLAEHVDRSCRVDRSLGRRCGGDAQPVGRAGVHRHHEPVDGDDGGCGVVDGEPHSVGRARRGGGRGEPARIQLVDGAVAPLLELEGGQLQRGHAPGGVSTLLLKPIRPVESLGGLGDDVGGKHQQSLVCRRSGRD